MAKIDEMVFLAAFFHHLIKVIETVFARDLGGIIQRYMGYDWATTDHDAIRVGYFDTQLGHSTRAPTSTSGEGEHQTENSLGRHLVCCGRSAAASCAT